MKKEREQLGSRLGFILLSAGCAIGCGNVWKFPWMTGQYGGGGFVLVYILCLLLLGLPAMTMEFAMGRASQASPVRMYQKLEKPGQKWHIHGYLALLGNIALMAFYTVVTGWMMYYFVQFLIGKTADLGFVAMITNPGVNVVYLAVAVVLGFVVLSFDLQGGLERVTKYLMVALFALMLVLAVHSGLLSGAKEGLKFYLVPDFSKINGQVIVGAMNQAFFTLSIGIGSMAIFGSYIGKDRSLMGESVNVILLDTFVAIMAGFIMFPACFTYGIEVDAGPSLLFNTMATVFNNMAGGRFWGTLFFLFMVFAAFSTDRLEPAKGMHCLRDRDFPAGSDNGTRLQCLPLPALCRRFCLAGLLGLHRQYQPASDWSLRFCCVLLLRLRLGLGQFPEGSKCRQGHESAELDEAGVQVFCSGMRYCSVYLRPDHLRLEVIRSIKFCTLRRENRGSLPVRAAVLYI